MPGAQYRPDSFDPVGFRAAQGEQYSPVGDRECAPTVAASVDVVVVACARGPVAAVEDLLAHVRTVDRALDQERRRPDRE